jgi:hypothetical protein
MVKTSIEGAIIWHRAGRRSIHPANAGRPEMSRALPQPIKTIKTPALGISDALKTPLAISVAGCNQK